MQTPNAIEFDHVTKVFPKAFKPSVQDCSFQVQKEDVVFVASNAE